MKTVVVTGATSFIGVHLIQELQKEYPQVYAVVRPSSKHLSRLNKCQGVQIIPCFLQEMERLAEIIPEQIDVFYHLAWEGARQPYRDDKIIQQINYEAAVQAYLVAKDKKCKKFIGVGSQAEYGKTQGVITEKYPEHPTTSYGIYKLKAHREIEKRGRVDGISVIWPRLFSVYGKYDYSGTLVMSALAKMKQNQTMDFTECIQNWNYLYVKDIGRMLRDLGGNACEEGTYNLASRDNRPLKKYVEEMRKILGSSSKLNFGAISYGAEGIVSFQPSIEKFERNFPGYTFKEFRIGIEEILF